MTEGLRAAVRDASWYRNPNVYGAASKYHVLRDEPATASRHRIGISGCNIFTFNSHAGIDATIAASAVLPAMRCMRPGCRVRWPDYQGEGSTA